MSWISGREQACAKIPKISGILDLQDPRSEILEDFGSSIFIFSWDPAKQLISWRMVGSIIIEIVSETMTIKLPGIY